MVTGVKSFIVSPPYVTPKEKRHLLILTISYYSFWINFGGRRVESNRFIDFSVLFAKNQTFSYLNSARDILKDTFTLRQYL